MNYPNVPVSVYIITGLFISIASIGICARLGVMGDFASQITMGFVSVLAAIFIATLAILTAIQRDPLE